MRLPIQSISAAILMALLFCLSSCDKDMTVVKTSATINGYNYVDCYTNSIVDHRELIPQMEFVGEFNIGRLILVLYPEDKSRPSYRITIYVKGNRDDFGKGKVYKIGYTTEDLSTIEKELDSISKYIPAGSDGIAFCREIIDGYLSDNIYQPSFVKHVNLIGEIEITTDKNQYGYYEGKYNFKSIEEPTLNITNGYLKVRI